MLGSISVVEADWLKAQKNNSKADISKITGLQINPMPQKNVNNGIRIGGANSSLMQDHRPLVVLNGKVVDVKKIQELDPHSIETVNTLTGASATALCGSNAQNGVIVVTTKKKWRAKK